MIREALSDSSDGMGRAFRHSDDRLVQSVSQMTHEAAALVPDLVGLTLGRMMEGLVITVVATDPQIAALDGVQYVDDGPCVRAMETGQTVYLDHLSQVDEGEWRLFAQAGAAAGVKSKSWRPSDPPSVFSWERMRNYLPFWSGATWSVPPTRTRRVCAPRPPAAADGR